MSYLTERLVNGVPRLDIEDDGRWLMLRHERDEPRVRIPSDEPPSSGTCRDASP